MGDRGMDLLERYLRAVGQYLPAQTRADVLAELRENLLAQMEERADVLGRTLMDLEIAAMLQAHGRPMLVAMRYLPQRSLIGPTFFPVYLMTLRRSAPFVVLVYFIARMANLFILDTSESVAKGIVASVLQLVPVMLIYWATVTLVFVALEVVTQHYRGTESWSKWDPMSLPPLPAEPSSKKEKSMGSRIADLVLHCLWMLYVLTIPAHPYLILGPGVYLLQLYSCGFAPVWQTFYLMLLVLLFLQLGMKIMGLMRNLDRWQDRLELITKLLGAGATGLLAATKVYFVATGPGANLQALGQVNFWMNVSFRIVLLVVLLDLGFEVWKQVWGKVPAERFAF